DILQGIVTEPLGVAVLDNLALWLPGEPVGRHKVSAVEGLTVYAAFDNAKVDRLRSQETFHTLDGIELLVEIAYRNRQRKMIIQQFPNPDGDPTLAIRHVGLFQDDISIDGDRKILSNGIVRMPDDIRQIADEGERGWLLKDGDSHLDEFIFPSQCQAANDDEYGDAGTDPAFDRCFPLRGFGDVFLFIDGGFFF